MQRLLKSLLVIVALLAAGGARADSLVSGLSFGTSLTGSVIYLDQGPGSDRKLGLNTSIFGIASNALTISDGAIANAKIANPSMTIGSTVVSLGGGSSFLNGLTLNSPTFTGTVAGNMTFGGGVIFTNPPTITSLAGASQRCVNISSSGLLGAALVDCGGGVSIPVPVAQGGTGATTAAAARTSLGLGTAATQDTGTSGPTLGLLNGNLVFGGLNTFTSAPTVTSLAGAGTRCLHVDNTGLFGLAAADCGASGGGNVIAPSPLTANQLTIGQGGTNLAPLGSTGTASLLLHGSAAGIPSFGAVALGSEVSGTLPAVNMLPLASSQVYLGNGSSQPVSSSLSAALDAGFGTTVGSTLVRTGANWMLLTPGASGTVLTSNGSGVVPSYAAPSGAGITQITGAVTAGPGSGTQVATIAPTGVVAGARTVSDGSTTSCWTIAASGQISNIIAGACSSGASAFLITTGSKLLVDTGSSLLINN